MLVQPTTITISVVGETTGEEFAGVFKVKPLLTTDEQITRDQVMRDILGSNPQDASPRAKSQAFILAEIRTRSTETPAWWKESGAGALLYDESVVSHIYDKIQEAEKQWRADVKTKADVARAALRKTEPTDQ